MTHKKVIASIAVALLFGSTGFAFAQQGATLAGLAQGSKSDGSASTRPSRAAGATTGAATEGSSIGANNVEKGVKAGGTTATGDNSARAWTNVYAEAKGWQSSIAAVLGFAGLVVGALFNAHLNRRRDKRLRDEEVVALASALYGEIVVFRTSLARLANAVGSRYVHSRINGYPDDPFDAHFIEQVSMPLLRLYPGLSSKIGILPGQLALDIVHFYARMEQAQSWLPRLQDLPERPYSYSVNHVLDPAIDAIKLIAPALRYIEAMAGIIKTSSDPVITDAEKACETERITVDQHQI